MLLDAYQRLRAELGSRSPRMVIIGQKGWMSEDICRRLARLPKDRSFDGCRASPIWSWREHIKKRVFLLISRFMKVSAIHRSRQRMRWFPMVVSSESSVGEIWSGYAKCVKPTDVNEIVSGWKWGLGLKGRERQAVVERQEKRAAEFTWKRCIEAYVQLYEQLSRCS